MSDSNRLTSSLMNTNFANTFLNLPQTEVDSEKKRFMEELSSLMNEIGKSLTKMPVMGYRELDLYTFYKEVQAHGGYCQVTDKVGTWSKIWKKMGNYDTSITDASFRLKKNYERFLLEYEYKQFPERRREESKIRNNKRTRNTTKPKLIVQTPQNISAQEPADMSISQKRRRVTSVEDFQTDNFHSSSPETSPYRRNDMYTKFTGPSSAPAAYNFMHSASMMDYNDRDFLLSSSPPTDHSPDFPFENPPTNFKMGSAVTPINYLGSLRHEPDASLFSPESLDMTVGEDCLFPEIFEDDKSFFSSTDDFEMWFKN